MWLLCETFDMKVAAVVAPHARPERFSGIILVSQERGSRFDPRPSIMHKGEKSTDDMESALALKPMDIVIQSQKQ